MPLVYKIPLLYSQLESSFEKFFDEELEKILSRYSFFVRFSRKNNCMMSTHIYKILIESGVKVEWYRIVGTFHFICCIIRDQVRYYLDNETKAGFGMVYIRVDGDPGNDITVLKSFYNSENYKKYGEFNNQNVINKFDNVLDFITPHQIENIESDEVQLDKVEVNSLNNTPKTSKVNEKGEIIRIDSSLIDGYGFKTSTITNIDDSGCFTLSPTYENVFNQFKKIVTNELYEDETLTDKEMKELLKLCLLIPFFKLETYKSTVTYSIPKKCSPFLNMKGGSKKKKKYSKKSKNLKKVRKVSKSKTSKKSKKK